MKAIYFSNEPPNKDDEQFIQNMLQLFELFTRPLEPRKFKTSTLIPDDVIKLARELDLSVESIAEVMQYKKTLEGD